jgi:hypothetical protein
VYPEKVGKNPNFGSYGIIQDCLRTAMESKSVRHGAEPDFLPYFPQAISTSPISYLIKPLPVFASDFFCRFSPNRLAASLSLAATCSE